MKSAKNEKIKTGNDMLIQFCMHEITCISDGKRNNQSQTFPLQNMEGWDFILDVYVGC